MLTIASCAGIVYGSFCRLWRMTDLTPWYVRWSYACLGTAAAGLAIAPFVPEWHWRPHPIVTALVLAQLFTLISMAPMWNQGRVRV